MHCRHCADVATIIQGHIDALDDRLAAVSDSELRIPLEAQLADQRRQLSYVKGVQ